MRFLRRKRVFALLLLMFVLILFLNTAFIGKKLYPIYYQKEIRQSAANHNVDPFLIAAIIRVETNFQRHSESSKGAVGIMQLMPDTAAWIVDSANLETYSIQDLSKPEVNIHLGSWYLRWLLQYYNGNMLYAIAAYNAGQGNVDKWRQSKIWDGTSAKVSDIPFGETRHYVQRVIYYYKKYQILYGKDWIT